MGISRDDMYVVRGDGGKEPVRLWMPNNKVVGFLTVLLLLCGVIIGALAIENQRLSRRNETYESRIRLLAKEIQDTNATTFLWMSSVKVECTKAGVSAPDPDPSLMKTIEE